MLSTEGSGTRRKREQFSAVRLFVGRRRIPSRYRMLKVAKDRQEQSRRVVISTSLDLGSTDTRRLMLMIHKAFLYKMGSRTLDSHRYRVQRWQTEEEPS